VKQRSPRDHGDRERRWLPGAATGLRRIAGTAIRPVAGVVTLVRWLRASGIGAAVRNRAEALARSVVGPLSFDVDVPESSPPSRGRRDWFLLLDVAAAVVLYILAAVWLIEVSDGLGDTYPPQLMHLLAMAGTLPVALRRGRPLVAWQIVLVALVATSGWFAPAMSNAEFGHGGSLLPVFVPGQVIAYVLCLYTIASRTTRTLASGAWLWSLIGLVVIAAAGMSAGLQNAALWTWSIVIVSLVPLFGHNVRTRRRAEADLELEQRRAEQEQAARATLEERSRIARELHDVVAHNMSVIAIQAEAAPLRSPDDASALTADLAAIRATALETLTEMRRILGVLRNRDDQADTAPAPDLEQLQALVDKVAAAGVDVEMTVTGEARPVPPGVGVSVYRIVQESLSNVLHHAPGAAVTISLAYHDSPPAVRVRVENGPSPAGAASGDRVGARHGLVGMRERAAMLRGQFNAGPTDDGGFVVEAALPLEES
jgi:signal transduction histidine kinase